MISGGLSLAIGLWLAAAEPWGSAETQTIAKQAHALQERGQFADAARLYDSGFRLASQSGQTLPSIRFLSSAAGCHLAIHRYRDALLRYTQARDLALASKQHLDAGAILLNLSFLYLNLGDVAAAAESSERGLQLAQQSGQPYYQSQLLYLRAMLRQGQGRAGEAEKLFREALAVADRHADDRTRSAAQNQLGALYLRQNRLAEAEPLLLESYRRRTVTRDRDLHYSHLRLAELEARKRNFGLAKRLADAAIALLDQDSRSTPRHEFHHVRARVLFAAGDLPGAHRESQTAVRMAQRWRLGLLPADSIRSASESSLAQIYGGAIDHAMSLYRQTPDPQILLAAWLAAEDWRAASLRAYLSRQGGWSTELQAEYQEVLADYRAAVSERLRAPAAPDQTEALRVRLAELESRAGVRAEAIEDSSPLSDSFIRLRQSLPADAALISFYLGEHRSYRWTLVSNRLEASEIPRRSEVVRAVNQVRDEILAGRGQTAARAVYQQLFGSLPGPAKQKPFWILALDEALYPVPFAALASGTGSTYLVEEKTLQIVPGAWALFSSPRATAKRPLLALGDAIYNPADPRWKGPKASPSAIYLPRLAASAREVESSVRLWQPVPPNELLMGSKVARETLRQAIQRQPGIIHFAGHAAQNPDLPEQALLQLSLDPDGSPEALSTADIAAWQLADPLVVLSGCHTAAGSPKPGAGWLGLSRAWLMAGASGVVASQWPTPDDTGFLFEAFYRALNQSSAITNRAVATALRHAQLAALRSNSWRAHPKYWSAYLLVGRTR
jgi:CHAT domain-containing protein/tetratricopeptide (TPR) repeat protein